MNLIIHRQCTPVANNNRIPWKVYVKHLRHVKKRYFRNIIFLKKNNVPQGRIIVLHKVELNTS